MGVARVMLTDCMDNLSVIKVKGDEGGVTEGSIFTFKHIKKPLRAFLNQIAMTKVHCS